MNLEELDRGLRKLNTVEKELKNLNRRDMMLYFSKTDQGTKWQINSDKLMKSGVEVAVHKHDRFVAFGEHSHDYMEMMFVYSGEIHHRFNKEEICLKKGELLLMDMNASHSITPAGENDIAMNILIRRTFFDSFFLQQIAYDNKISRFVVDAIYNRNDTTQYLHFKSGDNERIWSLLLNILLEFYEQQTGIVTSIKAYMLLLFNELIRNYQNYLSSKIVEQVDYAIVVDIVGYVDKHYKTVSIKEMAEVFNYNSDYLGRRIKKLTGYSLRDLVKARKIREAARLLRNTDKQILNILEEINYSNSSYFYKQFKAEYGMTPDEYRKYK